MVKLAITSYNQPMKLFFLFIVLLGVEVWGKSWYFPVDSAGRYELELLADPYYSAFNIQGSLTSDPIPKENIEEESSVHLKLLSKFFEYKYFLAEVSANPFPILGVYFKSETPDFYQSAEVVDGLNLIQSFTTGFPDPGAVSLFFGNIASFVNDSGKTTGKGYSGMLFNFGNYHIRDNELIEDYWLEIEAKLKGTDIRDKRELSWSFGLSTKEHFNPDIADELKLAIKRQRTDRDYNGWSLFKNSELEYIVQLNRKKALRFWEHWDRSAIRYYALYGKRFPAFDGSVIFSFSLGVARDIEAGYRGELANEVEREWTFIIRPNILF